MAYIDTNTPDILCITETMPKNHNHAFTPYDLDNIGYNSFHNTNGRGVSIYVRNTIASEVVKFEPDFSISLWIMISIKNTKILVGVIYRSPNSTTENNAKLNDLLTKAIDIKANMTIITGDFNYKEIQWDTNCLTCGPDHPASHTYERINDLFLAQLVTEPTRFRQGEAQNTLDWVVTDHPNRITNLQYEPPLGEKGDHCIITCKLTVTFERNSKGGILQFGKANYEEFRNALSGITWEDTMNPMNVEQAWDFFLNIMTKNIDSYVPRSKPRLHKSPPWCNSQTRSATREKNKAWSTYKKNKNDANWAVFTSARNASNREVIKQKKDFERKIAQNIKTNPKVFWNYVKYATGGQKEIPTIRNDQGDSVTDDLEKAELFNQYFSEVYTVEDLENLPQTPTYQVNREINKCLLTTEKLRKQLDKPNISKAAGPDQLHPKLIYELREILIKPLYIIFNKSLEAGRLPSSWKEAYIKPIFKKGNKHMTSNYRPVSLTAVCCKILERLIRQDIMQHLEYNKLLSDHQHGFRSGRSCSTQLLEIMEIWSNLLEKGNAWDCVYLDFAKAFDKVPHHRLKMKIKAMGINGVLHKWLSDFLDNRNQTVVIKETKAIPRQVTSGIPQGSVLGPVMFIMYDY